MDANLNMWDYWRDKYGLTEAIEEYFPDLLGKNKDVQYGMAMVRAGEALIEKTMNKLVAEDDAFYEDE